MDPKNHPGFQSFATLDVANEAQRKLMSSTTHSTTQNGNGGLQIPLAT